jgi:alpha-tubulin suppressor-like RCC1 family protein
VQSGAVWCWGRNDFGQLGDGTTTNRSAPVRVQGLSRVTQIAAGGYHSCALRDTGRVFCWGYNFRPALGDGTRINRSTPVRVLNLTSVTAIAAGGYHSCALRDTGRIFCWGWNEYGQLGDGTTTLFRTTPARIEGAVSSRAIQVGAGWHHTCLLRETGRVACTGENIYGNLGDGTTTNRRNPVLVRGVSAVTQISANGDYSCALRSNGRAFCWGRNNAGQLGDGSITDRHLPVRVRNLQGAIQVEAGWAGHSCALRSTGRIFCWGNNFYGQLGDGTRVNTRAPVRVAQLRDMVQVAVGRFHSCGLDRDGVTFCWGSNDFGELGDGTNERRLTPVRVVD